MAENRKYVFILFFFQGQSDADDLIPRSPSPSRDPDLLSDSMTLSETLRDMGEEIPARPKRVIVYTSLQLLTLLTLCRSGRRIYSNEVNWFLTL